MECKTSLRSASPLKAELGLQRQTVLCRAQPAGRISTAVGTLSHGQGQVHLNTESLDSSGHSKSRSGTGSLEYRE